MNTKATVSFFQEIDAYIQKNQQVLASRGHGLKNKISTETLHLATAATAITDVLQAAALFSSIAGQKISSEQIVSLFADPSRLPYRQAFAYELDRRGWLYVIKGEKRVNFVDNTLIPFSAYKAEADSQTHIIWYILCIILAILMMLLVIFYPNV